MTSREDELMRRLRAAFQIEARESVETLATLLLDLEKAAPALLASPLGASLPGDVVETVYREAHNLKGAARAVNMAAIEALCQPLESVFSVWKKGGTPSNGSSNASTNGAFSETMRVTLSPQAFDALHGALKTIGQVLDAESSGQAVPEVHPIARQLAALAEGKLLRPGVDGFDRRQEEAERRAEERREEERRREERREEERREEERRRQQELRAPESEQRSEERRTEERREEDRRQAEERREEERRQEDDRRLQLPADVPADRRRAPAKASAKAPELETVRIATQKLDALLLQAEELLTAKQAARRQSNTARELLEQLALLDNEWAKILPPLRTLIESDGRRSSALLDFIEWQRAHLKKLQGTGAGLAAQLSGDGRALGSLIDALLEDTKKLLMLPCAALLMQFPRTVRDVARERGKDVEFLTEGGDVEVDKRILEAMKAPLLHLLRNAVDHGIEPPDERLALGKPERATIGLKVTQSGGEVEFRISDDGGGLNLTKIKERAVQNGLLTADLAAHLTPDSAAQLIFASDLSTSDRVDEVSGRGLGMAIVRDQVERLGGRVAIETTPQKGTIFRLTLPQTLATFRGLLTEAGGQVFVIPTSDVTQVARVRRDAIQVIGNRETVRLNERTLRLLPLVDALGMPGVKTEENDWQIVVVLGGERGTAFQVDAILDEQEVLVKRLGWPLLRVRHVTGATVLADGRAAPILNAAELLQSAVQGNVTRLPRAVHTSEETPTRPQAKSVLVVDDSITSRMLLKDILEASGFRVQTAVDGLDALTILRGGQFDLLVSDVDMPRLNGFDLVERVRGETQWKELPTVLVTGRDSPEDRERGFDAGANAYVVKSNFDQSNLLEIVRRLI